jgi:hypothetical protein
MFRRSLSERSRWLQIYCANLWDITQNCAVKKGRLLTQHFFVVQWCNQCPLTKHHLKNCKVSPVRPQPRPTWLKPKWSPADWSRSGVLTWADVKSSRLDPKWSPADWSRSETPPNSIELKSFRLELKWDSPHWSRSETSELDSKWDPRSEILMTGTEMSFSPLESKWKPLN